MRWILALSFVLSAAALAYATDASRPQPVRAVRRTGPIVVDGILDEPVWRSADAVMAFRQNDPHQGSEPSQRTEVRIAYDDDAVYVGARMWDTHPDSIVARLSRRDSDGGSDAFAVAFDTFRDRRTAYYLTLTAAGTQLDGTLMNDDWGDDSWDGVWNGRVQRDSLGWTAEMRFPFSQIRCRGGEHMVWGVNFARTISRTREDDKIVYTPRGQSGYVSRFPDLVGLDGVRTSHVVEVTPYATGKASYLVHTPGDPFRAGGHYTPAIGGDLRTNVGSRLTLNATLNPDFGQVEIDPAVVNLSDVETYYGEKRPFFTDGLPVFRCGNNGASDYWNFDWPEPTFFYTRRIGRTPQGGVPGGAVYADMPVATHILGAVKLTGQPAPRWNVGMLHAITREEAADYQLGDGSRHSATVEPLTYYGVLRGMCSFHGERQGLGIMAMETARALEGTSLPDQLNRNGFVTAVDGWTALDPQKTWVLSGHVSATRVDGTAARIAALERSPQHYYQRPERGDLGVDANATALTGVGARVWVNRQKGPWMSNSAVGFLTPGYDVNDLGFGSRSDVINGHVGFGYMWDKPKAWRNYWWVIGAVAQSWDFGGLHTMNQLFLKSSLEQVNAWSWQASGGWMGRAYSDRMTRGGPAMLQPRAWWGDLYWDTNGQSRLFPSAEVNPSGDVVGSLDIPINPAVTWKPSSNLSFSAGPSFDFNRQDAQYVTRADDPLAVATDGGRYVFARLKQTTMGATARLDCSLTSHLTVQLYVQPLVSSGRYAEFRELARASAYDFLAYGRDGGSTISGGSGDADVIADPDGAGPAPSIDLGHPDFTYRTVRGDAVLRWEYAPGSALYVVWTQDRTGLTGDGDFSLRPSLSALGRTPANNIVMVKVSHHFEI
jgi:hypothetical protein